MFHRAFEVFIQSNGQRLDEFDVKVESDRVVNCFIPSESNKVRGPSTPIIHCLTQPTGSSLSRYASNPILNKLRLQ